MRVLERREIALVAGGNDQAVAVLGMGAWGAVMGAGTGFMAGMLFGPVGSIVGSAIWAAVGALGAGAGGGAAGYYLSSLRKQA